MRKKAMVMPVVLIVTFLISLLVGTYMSVSSVNMSKQFNIDLAEVRGYWGAYGAKELNISRDYAYENYDIKINKITSYTYKWSLSGLTDLNNSIYTRILKVNSSDLNKTVSYE